MNHRCMLGQTKQGNKVSSHNALEERIVETQNRTVIPRPPCQRSMHKEETGNRKQEVSRMDIDRGKTIQGNIASSCAFLSLFCIDNVLVGYV